MEHPEGLDESVLVGDGGRSWFKSQQRNLRRNQSDSRHHNDERKAAEPSQFKQEQTKLLSKQEKNRLKRQKKKQRKHQRQQSNTSNNSNCRQTSNSRSDFLYGNRMKNDNKNNNHPLAKPVNNEHYQRHEKRDIFKTYVKSSNQEELNKISAQMLKAKLLSNTDLYHQLQEKLNKLRNESVIVKQRYKIKTLSKNNENHNNHQKDNELIDEKGKRIELITNAKIAKKLHEMNKMNETNKTNEDDDINTLLKKERNETGLDYDKSLFRNKNIRRIMTMDTDDQFDSIDNDKLFGNKDRENQRKRKRGEIEKEEKAKSWKRARLISQHKHESNWLSSCKYCIENEDIHNNDIGHTVIYYGNFMYLAIPKQECIVDYQFCIIPNVHIKSFREGILNNDNIGASKDEQLLFEKELYTMQKIICKLFKSKFNSGVIFIETVRNLKKNFHSIIHGYPMEVEKYNFSPTYFKKSILESDVMWTTNKQIIEISKDKPLNKSIPSFMSYFYVQFGLYDGYVHIIEDETKIKQDFGPQIIAGIVEKVLFKIKNETYNKQIERAKIFKEIFEPFRKKLDSKIQKIKSNKVDESLT